MTRRSLLGLAGAVACVLALGCAGRPEPTPILATTAADQLTFGVDMARRGLWSEALFRFQQADRLEPGSPKTYNNIAVAYEALGDFERALEFYQSAIKADPGNSELKRNYSRFVEFYRSFRPAGPDAEKAGELAAGGTP